MVVSMWECNYGEEPIDLKLLFLRFIRKMWLVLVGTTAGVLLIGGGYFLVKVVYAPAREYKAESVYYVDFAVPDEELQYTYINEYTWGQWITTDVFTDYTLKHMKHRITKEELTGYITAKLPSDLRVTVSTVVTHDPELTIDISKALEQAYVNFGRIQKECREIRVVTSPDKAELVTADVRVMRACILGGMIGLFVTVFSMLLWYILDDSVYVPETFERRYHIPMLGTLNSAELQLNYEYLFREARERGADRIAVTAVDDSVDIEKAAGSLPWEMTPVSCICGTKADARMLREAGRNFIIGACRSRKRTADGTCVRYTCETGLQGNSSFVVGSR